MASQLARDPRYDRDEWLWPSHDGDHSRDGIRVPNIHLFRLPPRASRWGCDVGHDYDGFYLFARIALRLSRPSHDHGHGREGLEKFLEQGFLWRPHLELGFLLHHVKNSSM